MVTNTPVSAVKRLTNGTIFAHIDFVITGVVMTMLGPMLPILSARWSLNDTQAGNLFLAQYVSSTGGMLSSGVMVRRYGYRITLMLGALLMAIGVAILGSGGRLWGFGGICVLGFGFGVTTPACNLFVSDAMPQRRASALNLLNSSWGVGAMSSPLIIAAVQRVHQTTTFFYVLAACLAALALGLAAVRFIADENRRALPLHARPLTPWNTRLVILVGAIFFIYVGSETAVGGWVASYAQRVVPGSPTLWAMIPAYFYGMLLIGRVLAPVVLRSLREVRVAAIGAAIGLIGILLLLTSTSIAMIVAGSAIAGLGFSTIYPIKVSLLPRWFGDRVTGIGGFMFAIGNFGGGVLPWFVGALSTHFSSLRAGFIVPLMGAAALMAFYGAQGRISPPERRAA
jgi:FHS family glucose/mannose:H+ symporter-like MFS transporter